MSKRLPAVFLALLICSSLLFGQAGSTAVPFLLIGNSVAGNGMGEIRGSMNSGSALMETFNPGLLGVQSFSNRYNSEFYVRRTFWLPDFRIPDLYLISGAFTIGSPVDYSLSDQLPLSMGLGYSQTYLNLGEFITTSEKDPTEIIRFNGFERVDALSIGTGISFGPRLGLGINMKHIYSSLSPIVSSPNPNGAGTASLLAFDVGTFLHLPILGERQKHFSQSPVAFSPFISGTAAYVYGNIGGPVSYGLPDQDDPLPREITAGVSLTGGIDMQFFGSDGNLFSLTIVREAETIAVRRNRDQWSYQYGLGDIDPMHHLINGIPSQSVSIRKGFELSLFSLVTFRSGLNKMAYRSLFTTEGIEVHMTGLLLYIYPMNPPLFEGPVMSFIFRHLDLRYVKSSYYGASILSGSSFEGILFSVKH